MNLTLLHKSIYTAAEISFSRSGGPGGQNVNKVNTKVTLRLRLDTLMGLNEAERNRLQVVLGSRLSHTDTGPELIITCSNERSQKANLERAYARIEVLVATAARVPKVRRAVKPSRAAREERLRSKRYQSLKKTDRRRDYDE